MLKILDFVPFILGGMLITIAVIAVSLAASRQA